MAKTPRPRKAATPKARPAKAAPAQAGAAASATPQAAPDQPATVSQPPAPHEPVTTDQPAVPGQPTRINQPDAPDQPAATTPPATRANPAKEAKATKATKAVKKAVKKAAPPKRAPREVAVAANPPGTEAPAAEARPTAASQSHQPTSTEPAAQIERATHVVDAARHVEPSPPTPADVWAAVLANPAHVPELLALAAVHTTGPRASAWAATARSTYPTATDSALARLAIRQFTRMSTLGSVVGALAGSYAPVALVSTAAITHAQLILHVAAAYGLDPADPRRAIDLLVLTGVHASRAEAEAALAAAREPSGEEGGLNEAVRRLGRMVAPPSAGWVVARLVNRYFPGTSLLAAMLAGTASAATVAARANAYFSQLSSESGRTV